MSTGAERGAILLDPHPRRLDQIFTQAHRARLEQLGDVVWWDGSPAPDAHVDAALPDAVAIVGQTALPRERLDRAPRLSAVVNVESNFLPNVDYDECFRRGIHVLSTAPVFAHAVAEMALGLALAAARHIPRGDGEVRSGAETLFDEGRNADAFLLRDKTLGVIGCGNLGRALLSLLRPFGGRIVVHDPWLQPAVIRELGAEPVGLEELLRRSRVVFAMSAVTTENEGAIGANEFASMQPGSVFVLTSRAAVVDWDAMLDAAASGHLQVATDAFPTEPIPRDERARTVPNTILSAHRAGNVPEVWPLMGDLVVDDLEWVLAGLPPQRCMPARRETVLRLRSKPVE